MSGGCDWMNQLSTYDGSPNIIIPYDSCKRSKHNPSTKGWFSILIAKHASGSVIRCVRSKVDIVSLIYVDNGKPCHGFIRVIMTHSSILIWSIIQWSVGLSVYNKNDRLTMDANCPHEYIYSSLRSSEYTGSRVISISSIQKSMIKNYQMMFTDVYFIVSHLGVKCNRGLYIEVRRKQSLNPVCKIKI